MIVQNWWYTTLLDHKYTFTKPLQGDTSCDVLIVGGGMSGMSAAARFIGTGLKVIVLEKNIIGGSSSGRSAGFLTPDSEMELSQLIRRYGVEGAKELWDAPVQGIELIKANVEKYNIDCDFRVQDSLFLGIGKDGWQDVTDEMDSRKQVGFTNQSLYDETKLKTILNSEGYTGGVRYSDTYGINSLQYLQGLKDILIKNGITVHESTEVRKMEGNTIYCHAGKVTAGQIIVAIDKMEKDFHPVSKEVFHAQTFLSVSEPLSDKEIQTMFPTGEGFQMWDNTLVYSYWRLIGGNRMLLGGGSAPTTFLPNAWYHEDVIGGVHSTFKKHFPFLRDLNFIQYWPGLIDTSRDLLPVMLRDQTNPSIHFISGVVGLPWASFCGDFVAKNILRDLGGEYNKYYEYFSDRRYFAFPLWIGEVFGKPPLFAANNGWAKYFQKDLKDKLDKKPNEF